MTIPADDVRIAAPSGWTSEKRHVVAASFLGWTLDAFARLPQPAEPKTARSPCFCPLESDRRGKVGHPERRDKS
jgi:hypothetical protein